MSVRRLHRVQVWPEDWDVYKDVSKQLCCRCVSSYIAIGRRDEVVCGVVWIVKAGTDDSDLIG